MSGGFATASATRLALAPRDDQLISQGTAPQSEINCICMVRKERFQMDDDDDPHEQILHIEAHIEELADVIESCRKFILISKAGMVAGGTLILAIVIGAVGFNPTVMIGALAVVIGGTVVCGSNTSTLKQATTAMKAAEAHRAELISRMDLRVVGDGEVGWEQ
jgi:hypothetical protein